MNAVKKRTILLLAFAVLLVVLAVPVRNALAYFTDYEVVKGSAKVQLSWQTKLEETILSNKKQIVVNNTGKTDAVVRVRIYGLDDYITIENSGDKWEQGNDGWWYYKEILPAGTKTKETLVASIEVNKEGFPAYDVNISVVHESMRAVYEDGSVKIPSGWQPPSNWLA